MLFKLFLFQQNIPQNLFNLPTQGALAGSLPTAPQQQQQSYSQQHSQGQQQSVFLPPTANQQQQAPESALPYIPSQQQSYGATQNTIMVSSTSSLMTATIKAPSSQNQYCKNIVLNMLTNSVQ